MQDELTNARPLHSRWQQLFHGQASADIKHSKERFVRQIAALLHQTQASPELTFDANALAKYFAGHIWYWQTQAPGNTTGLQYLQQVCFHAGRWSPNRGRIGRELPKHLETTIAILATPPGRNPAAWSNAAKVLAQYHATWLNRSCALEQRQLASEINLDRLELAKAKVAQKINEVLSGSVLPAWLSDFITETLSVDLAADYVNNDCDQTIANWLARLEELRDVYCHSSNPEATTQQQQWVYSTAPTLIDLYTEANFPCLPSRPEYRANFDRLVDSLVGCIRRQPEATQAYRPASSKSAKDAIKLSGSLTEIEQLAVNQGQWFHHLQEGHNTEAFKLFYLCHSSGKAYFSDYYGKVNLTLEADQLKLLMATKHLLPILNFQTTLNTVLERFIQQEEINARDRKTAEELQRQTQIKNRNAQQNKPQNNTPLDASVNTPTTTEQSIAKITQDIATARVPPQSEPLDTESNQSKNKEPAETKSFVDAISMLQLGAWLKITTTEPKLHKLALKLPSSDKYLFTDRLGRRSAEYKLQDLVELFQRDAVEIVSKGERFDTKLEQIVKNQRR